MQLPKFRNIVETEYPKGSQVNSNAKSLSSVCPELWGWGTVWMRLIIQLGHSQYECITMTHYYTNHFWWSNILAPGPFGQTKKKKKAIMKVWLEMCSLYNVQAGLYIIRYVWAACIPHCYIASRSSLEQRWAHNNMNFPICTLLLHAFILGCNTLCTQCSQMDWHWLYLAYRSGKNDFE